MSLRSAASASSAEQVAALFPMPQGCKPLTGRTLKEAVRDGRAGVSPKKKGPPSALPDALPTYNVFLIDFAWIQCNWLCTKCRIDLGTDYSLKCRCGTIVRGAPCAYVRHHLAYLDH